MRETLRLVRPSLRVSISNEFSFERLKESVTIGSGFADFVRIDTLQKLRRMRCFVVNALASMPGCVFKTLHEILLRDLFNVAIGGERVSVEVLFFRSMLRQHPCRHETTIPS